MSTAVIKRLASKTSRSSRTISDDSVVQPRAVAAAARTRVSSSNAQTDWQLVDRCLAGEIEAWETLYNQCHGPLCVSIRSLMGPGCDSNVIEEIAARVWHAVVRDDGRLLKRFNPSRHVRLNTYFRGLARVERMLYTREECRHHPQEIVAGGADGRGCRPSESQIDAWMSDFTETLSEDERNFLEEYLVSSNHDDADTDCLEGVHRRIMQWRRRVMAKLMTFLAVDDKVRGY